MNEIQRVVFYSFEDDGFGDPVIYCGRNRRQIEEMIRLESVGLPAELQPNPSLLQELSGEAQVHTRVGDWPTLTQAYGHETEARCIGAWDREQQCVVPITWKAVDKTAVPPAVASVAESLGVRPEPLPSYVALARLPSFPKGYVKPELEQATAAIRMLGSNALRKASTEIVDILSRHHPDFQGLILKQVDVEWNLRSWAASQAEFPPGSEPWATRDAGGSSPASGSPPASAQTSAHPSSAAPAFYTPDLP